MKLRFNQIFLDFYGCVEFFLYSRTLPSSLTALVLFFLTLSTLFTSHRAVKSRSDDHLVSFGTDMDRQRKLMKGEIGESDRD